MVHSPPSAPNSVGAEAPTGCFGWTDAYGRAHWSARITQVTDGHSLRLDLGVDGQQIPPLGTHFTNGPDAGTAVLTVDDVRYPADATSAYFDLDNDGSTGQVVIQFTTDIGLRAFRVLGRWRCA
jgi:hypothetical protein